MKPFERCVSPEQMRRVDAWAIHTVGIPGVVLMENAGRAVAERVKKKTRHHVPVYIFCGKGNNGGDGLVVARWLRQFCISVQVVLPFLPHELSADARVQYDIAKRLKIPITKKMTGFLSKCVVVDALLGTGFRGNPRPPYHRLIHAINSARDRGAYVLAVDIPSGLDGTSGKPSSATVRAQETVTFQFAKTGFKNPKAKKYVGRVTVADIGIPSATRS